MTNWTSQCIEFVGTRDEIRGQALAHERTCGCWFLDAVMLVLSVKSWECYVFDVELVYRTYVRLHSMDYLMC